MGTAVFQDLVGFKDEAAGGLDCRWLHSGTFGTGRWEVDGSRERRMN
jgi:hypothetical protein